MLVEGDGHAVAGAANRYAFVDRTALHGFRQGMRKVGVVAGIFGVGTEVHHLISLAFQILHKLLLVFHACVVVADTDFHNSSLML